MLVLLAPDKRQVQRNPTCDFTTLTYRSIAEILERALERDGNEPADPLSIAGRTCKPLCGGFEESHHARIQPGDRRPVPRVICANMYGLGVRSGADYLLKETNITSGSAWQCANGSAIPQVGDGSTSCVETYTCGSSGRSGFNSVPRHHGRRWGCRPRERTRARTQPCTFGSRPNPMNATRTLGSLHPSTEGSCPVIANK